MCTCHATLAHALPSPDAEDSFICTVLELDPADSALLHSAAAASLRRLLAHAQELCPSPNPSSGSIPSLASAQPSSAHKLTPSEVQDMRKKFLSSYPGELLTPELMPAPEFCPHSSMLSLQVPVRGCRGDPAAQRPMPYRGMMLAARALTASSSVAFLKLRKSRRALLHMSPRLARWSPLSAKPSLS